MNNCFICNSEENLEKHHKQYKPERIVIVCKKCHELIHHTNDYIDLKPIDDSFYYNYGGKTIKIKPETHARLMSFGYKGETFDDIINRVLEATTKFKPAKEMMAGK